jgi:hypothetical protein
MWPISLIRSEEPQTAALEGITCEEEFHESSQLRGLPTKPKEFEAGLERSATRIEHLPRTSGGVCSPIFPQPLGRDVWHALLVPFAFVQSSTMT